MKIPPSIDELMWLVAEGADAAASEKFCQRYPEFRGELLKRMRIVRDLKGARHETRPAPPFRPRFAPAPARPLMRLGTAGGALVGLAVVALGSYTLALRFGTPAESPPPPMVASLDAARKPMPPADPPTVEPADPPVRVDSPVGTVHTPAMPESPYTRRIALAFRQVPIEVVLRGIGSASGLRVQIAPGLPSRTVSVEVAGTGPSALSDLGARFGFTAFDQGRGEFLVIPAVDEASVGDKFPTEVPPAEDGRGGAVEGA